jgi:hypothetical protein
MDQANTNLVRRSGRSGRPQSPVRVVNSLAFIWRHDTRELEQSTTTRAVPLTGALRAAHCQVAGCDGSEMDPTSNVLESLADGPGTTARPPGRVCPDEVGGGQSPRGGFGPTRRRVNSRS